MKMPLPSTRMTTIAVLAWLAGAANAGTCTIAAKCQADRPCHDRMMSLSWPDLQSGEITVNGSLFSADWIKEPIDVGAFESDRSTITIRTRGPFIHASEGRTTVVIVPAELPNEIIVTAIHMPERYVDYEDAMNARLVFGGTCEGLF